MPGARPRRYPTRSCVACRTPRQKRELVRVVRAPDGSILMDPSGRHPGRGAYLCADGSCWRQAIDKGALQHALKAPLPLELRALLEAGPRPVEAAAAAERTTITIDQGGTRGQK